MPTLPPDWVDAIFAKMTATYGSAWLNMWEGVRADVVKGQWAVELGGFINRKDAIMHALEHLPVDRPPNSLQFRVICMGAPELTKPEAAPQLPGMPAQKADISRLITEVQRLKALQAEVKTKPKQWAWDLRQREKDGEALTDQQRKDWRLALHEADAHEKIGGEFKNIDIDCLPPGMREAAYEAANRGLR